MTSKHWHTFWHSLLNHIAVICVIALTLIPISQQVNNVVRQQEVENRRSILENGLDMATEQLSSLGATLTTSSSEYFSRASLIRGTPAASDVTAINKTREHIASISGSNPLVAEIAVLFAHNRMVITSRQSFYDLEDFLGQYQVKGMEKAVFSRYHTEKNLGLTMEFYPCGSISGKGMPEEETAFCFAVPLDLALSTAPRGVAFVFIRREPLLELMLSSSLQQSGDLLITDRRSTELMRYTASQAVESHEDDVVMQLVNNLGTLQVTARMPQSYFNEVTKPVWQKMVFLLVAVISVGLLSAFIASYRQSKPIRKLVQELADQGFLEGGRNEFAEIRSSLEKLRSERDDVSKQLGDYQQQLKSNLADRLFRDLLGTTEWERRVEKYFPAFPQQFLVYYGRILTEDVEGQQSTVARMIAADLLCKRLPENTVFHWMSRHSFGLIFPCPHSAEETEEALRHTLTSFKTMRKVDVRLATGGTLCDHPSQIGRAYEDAKILYLRRYADGDTGDALPEEEGTSPFRMRDLQDFYRLLSGGDAAHAQEVATRCILSGESPCIDMEQRYATLRGILLLVAEELAPGVPFDLPKYGTNNEPEELLSQLQEGCQLVSGLGAHHQGQKSPLGSRFLAYLEEHYSDPELCAASMAKAFGFSEKYLFSLFREETGHSPASYLQKIRLRHAAELLKNTALTTQQVGEQVGFLNPGTFHKAFKREYGEAPGQFRTSVSE